MKFCTGQISMQKFNLYLNMELKIIKSQTTENGPKTFDSAIFQSLVCANRFRFL